MLPKKTQPVTVNPRKLFIFAHTKVGKTTLVAGLNNCLVVDTENGSDFIEGIKYNLIKESEKLKMPVTKTLRLLTEEIKKENEKKGFVYDYIAIDTASGLEIFADGLATWLYKQTPLGKNYTGDSVVIDLSNGGGYMWLRKAFNMLYGYFEGLAKHGLVITGHVKQSSILKDGKDLNAKDIMLTGKLKYILTADCDAIGYLFRNKKNNNEVIISFKTHEQDLATGARPAHLRNQEFCISELTDKGFVFHWDKIYKEYKNG
ncbi:MAG: hypothetical protein CO128_03260 [Ignavibacteriales bacterium CG_4_9_14_3_um_filter_30_11]|nr:MAG: hypothetical protein CO128_03260 [Ignavibacteriales bacterium CG_4_9_14_3_um_filter_30_11]